MTLMFPILSSRIAHKRMETPKIMTMHLTPSKNKKMTIKELVCAQKRIFKEANLNVERYCSEIQKHSYPLRQARPRRRAFRYHRL